MKSRYVLRSITLYHLRQIRGIEFYVRILDMGVTLLMLIT